MGKKLIQYFDDEGRLVDTAVEPWNEERIGPKHTPHSIKTKCDLYSKEALELLLSHCDVPHGEALHLISCYAAEKLTLAACRTIHLRDAGDSYNPRRLLLALLVSNSPIHDHRAQILKSLNIKQPPRTANRQEVASKVERTYFHAEPPRQRTPEEQEALEKAYQKGAAQFAAWAEKSRSLANA